jgi:hypothetical protein
MMYAARQARERLPGHYGTTCYRQEARMPKTRPISLTPRQTDQFWERVSKPDGEDGCWEWTGARDRRGYGRLCEYFAHRYSYTLHVGPMAPELVTDHLCRNHSCVNPSHLEPVTPRENTMRGVGPTAQKAQQEACVRGHDLDGVTDRGARYCKTCSTDRSLSAYQRRRAMGMTVTEARYGSPVKQRRRAA